MFDCGVCLNDLLSTANTIFHRVPASSRPDVFYALIRPFPIPSCHSKPVVEFEDPLKGSEHFNLPYWISKDNPKEKGGPVNESTIKIRLMTADDFDAVVGIDEKVIKAFRPEYYELKFEKLFESKEYLPTSLVAEEEDGTVVGFVMGELYMGEYGISKEGATLNTIGVDPYHQHKGIGKQLMNEFMDHLRELDVQKVNTLVDRNDSKLMHFFSANQFSPSQTIINLERSL